MNEKINIQDLIDMLAEKHGMSRKNADSFVREFFLLIEEALEMDKYVKVRGLGTFKLIDVDSRESVNVNTGERFQIQGHTKVSFTPDAMMKDIINRPFAHFETVALNDNTILEDTVVENEVEQDIQVEEESTIQSEEPEQSEVLLEEPPALSEDDAVVSNKRYVEDDVPQVPIGSSDFPDSDLSEFVKPFAPNGEQQKDVSKGKDSIMIKSFLTVVIIIAVLCGAAVAFLYYPDLLNLSSQPNREESFTASSEEPLMAPSETIQTVEITDSIPSDTSFTNTSVRKVPVQAEPSDAQIMNATPPAKAKKLFNPDSVNYKIVGTKTNYTIKEGETLTKVALKFFGTKAMWPYLVKHNSSVITNPDSVPYGTTLKIPILEPK